MAKVTKIRPASPDSEIYNRPFTISAQILGKRPKSSTTEEPNFSDMMRQSHLRQMEERGPEQVLMGDRDDLDRQAERAED